MVGAYLSADHKRAFEQMLEESYLTQEVIQGAEGLLRRQLAFIYLISYYQKDYAKYEGDTFYLDQGEELTLGGPTYLLEEGICGETLPHETILKYAKQILEGKVCDAALEGHQEVLVAYAKNIASEGMS